MADWCDSSTGKSQDVRVLERNGGLTYIEKEDGSREWVPSFEVEE